MQKAKKNHSTSITNLPYIFRSDLFFHAPTTKYSLVHILFFLLDILVSFELRVHSIDSCSYVLKSTQTIISAASSQSTHAPPVYPLISTRLDTISFTADKWSMFSKVFSNPYYLDFLLAFET